VSREELEARITARATEFDPIALVDLVLFLGYRPDEIFFESQPGLGSPATRILAIAFKTVPLRHVVVTVSHGLMGPQSPLPSYFAQLLSDPTLDDTAFLEFLHLFDHKLIDAFLKGASTERDASVFRDFDQVKKSYLSLVGIRSTSTLHWLFQRVFPELGVRVDRGTLRRTVDLEDTRLGYSALGRGSVLGGRTKVPVPGFSVTLFCDEEHTDFGYPWVEEARRRLDGVVFPVVADSAVDLRVSVVLRSEKVWAQLSPHSYLGFDRMKGGQRRNREILVWNGQVVPGSRCARRELARRPESAVTS
jgi:hypothetical protein